MEELLAYIDELTKENEELKRKLDVVDTLNASLESGMAAMVHECARIAQKEEESWAKLIAGGKGEWPKTNYVNDETWTRWQQSFYVAGSIARAIRSKYHRFFKEQ